MCKNSLLTIFVFHLLLFMLVTFQISVKLRYLKLLLTIISISIFFAFFNLLEIKELFLEGYSKKIWLITLIGPIFFVFSLFVINPFGEDI